jgi:hypothetical protein
VTPAITKRALERLLPQPAARGGRLRLGRRRSA